MGVMERLKAEEWRRISVSIEDSKLKMEKTAQLEEETERKEMEIIMAKAVPPIISPPSTSVSMPVKETPNDYQLTTTIILVKHAKDMFGVKQFATVDERRAAIKALEESTPAGYYVGFKYRFELGGEVCTVKMCPAPVQNTHDAWSHKDYAIIVPKIMQVLLQKIKKQPLQNSRDSHEH